jgi:hypothetical protein
MNVNDARVTDHLINRLLAELGLPTTDRNRRKLRKALAAAWRAGYNSGEPSVPSLNPYRFGRRGETDG